MRETAPALDRRITWTWLASLVLVKLASAAALHRWGFVSVSADEFSRGIRAVRWARGPRLDALGELTSGVWLPLEKYLNGSALLVWPDPIVAPRVTAFLSSCVLIVAVFVLARRLAADPRAALVASLLVVAQPWYAWLSATPALDTYWLACYLAGLGCWLAWLEERRRRAWFWAGVWFALASAFHYPSWIPIELTYALSLLGVGRWWRRRYTAAGIRSLTSWAIATSFIGFFVVIGWLADGRPLGFLESHTAYSKWFYGGYRVSLAQKLAYYPRLVVTHLQPGVWLLVPFAAWAAWRDRRRSIVAMPLGVGVLSLAAVSLMNVGSVPATAAPGRYALFHTIVLALYAGWGFRLIVGWAGSLPNRPRRWAARGLAVVVLVWIVAADLARWRAFPRGMPAAAVTAGKRLAAIAASGAAAPAGYKVMLETRYWDFLGVELASGLDERIVFDRERDKLRRDLPSRLLAPADDVRALLARDGVSFVAVVDPRLKRHLDALPFLTRLDEAGGWAIYRAGL